MRTWKITNQKHSVCIITHLMQNSCFLLSISKWRRRREWEKKITQFKNEQFSLSISVSFGNSIVFSSQIANFEQSERKVVIFCAKKMYLFRPFFKLVFTFSSPSECGLNFKRQKMEKKKERKNCVGKNKSLNKNEISLLEAKTTTKMKADRNITSVVKYWRPKIRLNLNKNEMSSHRNTHTKNYLNERLIQMLNK